MMTLLCPVFGEEGPFPVDIGEKLVGHLKDEIHRKQYVTFKDIPANRLLKLWAWNKSGDEVKDSDLDCLHQLDARKTLNSRFHKTQFDRLGTPTAKKTGRRVRATEVLGHALYILQCQGYIVQADNVSFALTKCLLTTLRHSG